MVQFKNQNIYKIVPRGKKEIGTILAGTKNEFGQLKKKTSYFEIKK